MVVLKAVGTKMQIQNISDILTMEVSKDTTLFIADNGDVRDTCSSKNNEVIFNGKVYDLEVFKSILLNEEKPDETFIMGMRKVWHLVTHTFKKDMRNLAIDWFYNANLSPMTNII